MPSADDRMLERLARNLGKAIDDATVRDALDDAVDVVKNYCNIEEIPPALELTVVRIARDVWRAAGYGQEQAPQEIKSISRGDVSTSFEKPGYSETDSTGGAGFVQAYQKILNSFRKLR